MKMMNKFYFSSPNSEMKKFPQNFQRKNFSKFFSPEFSAEKFFKIFFPRIFSEKIFQNFSPEFSAEKFFPRIFPAWCESLEGKKSFQNSKLSPNWK